MASNLERGWNEALMAVGSLLSRSDGFARGAPRRYDRRENGDAEDCIE